ncbi:MAG: insulinase family protein, partial [Candidatus Limosilactobacillus intestinavium]
INDRQLDRVKKNIINGYLLGQDNPARLVERELVSALMNRQLDNNEIMQIEDVNISEIVNVAQQMKLQAVYFLDGR